MHPIKQSTQNMLHQRPIYFFHTIDSTSRTTTELATPWRLYGTETDPPNIPTDQSPI